MVKVCVCIWFRSQQIEIKLRRKKEKVLLTQPFCQAAVIRTYKRTQQYPVNTGQGMQAVLQTSVQSEMTMKAFCLHAL
jgi:hypothetical protein